LIGLFLSHLWKLQQLLEKSYMQVGVILKKQAEPS